MKTKNEILKLKENFDKKLDEHSALQTILSSKKQSIHRQPGKGHDLEKYVWNILNDSFHNCVKIRNQTNILDCFKNEQYYSLIKSLDAVVTINDKQFAIYIQRDLWNGGAQTDRLLSYVFLREKFLDKNIQLIACCCNTIKLASVKKYFDVLNKSFGNWIVFPNDIVNCIKTKCQS